jgi:mannose-6-phosphate isomerase
MIFKFEPIYKERIWGGTKIREYLNRDVPHGNHVGEAWEVVDRPNDNSIVANTVHKGKTLSALLKSEGKSVMGPTWETAKPFPLLVKWLDCSKRLSLQVHPPREVAEELYGESKTENWYVAEASEGAGLFAGLKRGTSAESFQQALCRKEAESLCHRISSQKGDSLLVESGRVHAIDSGNLILEIQQNSDTTYRVYDWERLGLDGRPRTLHVEESMRCIDFKDYEPKPISTITKKGTETIAESNFFRIRKFNLKQNDSIDLKDRNSDALMIHALEGSLHADGETLAKGEQALSPFSSNCSISSLTDTSFLVTDRFSGSFT